MGSASAAAATTTRGSNRKNSIGGFFVDKVVGDVMRKFLEDAKIPTDKVDPTIDGDEQLAVALSLYFREQVSEGAITEDDMCKCERCGGEGPATIPNCTFCGLEGEPDAVDATSTEALAAQVAAEEPKTSKKKSKKTTPEQPEATTTKKETEMTTEAVVTNGKGKKSAALATTPKGSKAIEVESQVVYTDKDLDKALARVQECKKVASVGLWALGNELRAINEHKLWKLRTVKGKAAYTSFDQFCDNEAKISHTYAYSLIEIAKACSEEDVQKFGTAKLTLMLKVAPEDMPAVREKAGKMGKRQLAKEVAKTVKERGHGAKKRNPKHSAAGKKGGKAKAAKTAPKNDKITVASLEGRKTVKLFAKPESIRNIDWKSLKRAKTLDALPFGKLELTNEVSIFLSVVKTDDGLEIIANTRRDVAE